jgi:hypothetical protein
VGSSDDGSAHRTPAGKVPADGVSTTAGVSWTAPTVRTVVHVTVAASTLRGLDDAPAELGGFGPISAGLARELASDPDATWQRILTDPATGIAWDLSRRTYRPGTVLGDLVRTRDGTCTFPGCRVPAWRCDLDHVEPFDATSGSAGQTRAGNLHPVCRSHHNLKTHGGWSTCRDPDTGETVWESASGHVHRVSSHVVDPSHVIEPGDARGVTTSRPAVVRAASPSTAPAPAPSLEGRGSASGSTSTSGSGSSSVSALRPLFAVEDRRAASSAGEGTRAGFSHRADPGSPPF